MEPQKFGLLGSQLKHKIVWEAVLVPFYSPIERLCCNVVKLGEIRIKHYLLTADQKNLVRDRLHGDELLR